MSVDSAVRSLRPLQGFINEVRRVLSESPEASADQVIGRLPSALTNGTYSEVVVQIGWALAELAAIEDAERLPGTPFGKRLREALIRTGTPPDFDQVSGQHFEPVPAAQYLEAPALRVWREAYLAALGALLDPTLHGSTTSGVNVRAKEIADQAAFDFFETERRGLAEIAAIAHGARKEPRQ